MIANDMHVIEITLCLVLTVGRVGALLYMNV